MRSMLRLSCAVVLVVPMFSAWAQADGFDRAAAAGPASAWNGPYVGVHDGGAWGHSDWSYANGSTTSPDFGTGALFGGHVGIQHQWYGIVLGAEVSYSGLPNVDERAWCPDHVGICSNAAEGLLLVNGRLGYAMGRALLYGTAGYARSTIEVQTDYGAALNARDDRRVSGWNIGGGLEYLITPNVVLGFDYIHVDFNDAAFGLRDNISDAFVESVNVDSDLDLVRARFAVRLDRDRAAYAPLK